MGETELQKEVRLASRHDEFAKEVMQNIKKGIKSHSTCEMDYYGISKIGSMFRKECHDGPLAGHCGAKRTTTFLKKFYHWLNLKDDAEEYMKTCLICQQNQTLNKK